MKGFCAMKLGGSKFDYGSIQDLGWRFEQWNNFIGSWIFLFLKGNPKFFFNNDIRACWFVSYTIFFWEIVSYSDLFSERRVLVYKKIIIVDVVSMDVDAVSKWWMCIECENDGCSGCT